MANEDVRRPTSFIMLMLRCNDADLLIARAFYRDFAVNILQSKILRKLIGHVTKLMILSHARFCFQKHIFFCDAIYLAIFA